MAKRKRLTPPGSTAASGQEVSPVIPKYPLGIAPKPMSRAPIAQVAGDAAAQSALDDLADEMSDARRQGRLVQSIALDQITEDHLVRDRMVLNSAEMDSLKASLRARGQQTPIEVVDRGAEGFGLISGWRRLQAFRALHAETGEAAFATIQALIKPIESVSDSYVAMVEENEIRASLSFYERAHLACEAARLGVYATPAEAVQVLFANATPARRSKISTFTRLHAALGPVLSFPAAIPEKLGLALVAALEADKSFATRLADMLRKTPRETAEAERTALERALKRKSPAPAPKTQDIAPGITLEAHKGRVVLRGAGVTPALLRDLESWLAGR